MKTRCAAVLLTVALTAGAAGTTTTPADRYLDALAAHDATAAELADAQAAEAAAELELAAARTRRTEALTAHKTASIELAAATAALPEGEPLPTTTTSTTTTTTTTTAPPAVEGQPDHWATDSIDTAAAALLDPATPMTRTGYLLAGRQFASLAGAVAHGSPSGDLWDVHGQLADPDHVKHDQARQWLHLAHRLRAVIPVFEAIRCHAIEQWDLTGYAIHMIGGSLAANTAHNLADPRTDPATPYLAEIRQIVTLAARWPDGAHPDHCS